MNKSIHCGIAMTGELSLTGKVLKIGGVKEKLIAAKSMGITTICVPEGNRADVQELEDYLKEGLEIHYCDVYEDVYKVVLA